MCLRCAAFHADNWPTEESGSEAGEPATPQLEGPAGREKTRPDRPEQLNAGGRMFETGAMPLADVQTGAATLPKQIQDRTPRSSAMPTQRALPASTHDLPLDAAWDATLRCLPSSSSAVKAEQLVLEAAQRPHTG